MDIEEMVESLRYKCKVCKRKSCNGHYWSLSKCPATLEAAEVLVSLQSENEKLRAELNDLKAQWDMYGGDVGITAVYAELEQVKRERDAAVGAAHGLDKIVGRAWGEED